MDIFIYIMVALCRRRVWIFQVISLQTGLLRPGLQRTVAFRRMDIDNTPLD